MVPTPAEDDFIQSLPRLPLPVVPVLTPMPISTIRVPQQPLRRSARIAANKKNDDADDENVMESDHKDVGFPVPTAIAIIFSPPLPATSARIASNKKSESCQFLEPPHPRSAPIAASGSRRSARLATKVRISYAL